MYKIKINRKRNNFTVKRVRNAIRIVGKQKRGLPGEPGQDGAQGPQGIPGINGQDGADGVGVPVGGIAGQVLAKNSGIDYDTEWVDQAGGNVDSVNGQTGTVVLDINDINDVNTDDAVDGSYLGYDSSAQTWLAMGFPEPPSSVWGNIVGTLSDQTDLQDALDTKVESIVAGANVSVDNTDPANPVVSTSGGQIVYEATVGTGGDFSTLNAAIASGAKSILVLDGTTTETISTTSSTAGLLIEGQSLNAIIDLGSNDLTLSGSGVTIRGLTINMTSGSIILTGVKALLNRSIINKNGLGTTVEMQAENATISNCSFDDVTETLDTFRIVFGDPYGQFLNNDVQYNGLYTSGWLYVANDAHHALISGNKMHYNTALAANPSDNQSLFYIDIADSFIKDNLILGKPGYARCIKFDDYNMGITGNYIYGFKWGIYLSADTQETNRAYDISGNQILSQSVACIYISNGGRMSITNNYFSSVADVINITGDSDQIMITSNMFRLGDVRIAATVNDTSITANTFESGAEVIDGGVGTIKTANTGITNDPTGGIESVIAGVGISVDNTDPVNPVVASTSSAPAWGDVTGTLTDQTDLNTELNQKLENITSLITAGTNVTITGAGTAGSPYNISAAGGGSGGSTDVLEYDIIVAPTGGDFTTVTAALASLSAGNVTIGVREGSYSESNLSTSFANVAIVGEGKEKVTLTMTANATISGDGFRLEHVSVNASTFSWTLSGGQVLLTNNYLTGANTSGAINVTGVYPRWINNFVETGADNAVFNFGQRATVTGNLFWGGNTAATGNFRYDAGTITGNIFRKKGSSFSISPILGASSGNIATVSDNFFISNNFGCGIQCRAGVVSGNVMMQNGYGIRQIANTTSGMVITGNTIYGTNDLQIDILSGTVGGQITNNTIVGTTLNNITNGPIRSAADKTLITGNTIQSTSTAVTISGIYSTGSRCVINGNIIDTIRTGITIASGTNSIVTSNVTTACTTAITDSGTTTQLANNVI